MENTEFSVSDDFAPVSYDAWREQVEKDLAGAPFEKKLVTRTYEGVDVQPVYTAQDWNSAEDPNGFPGFSHYLRGSAPLGNAETGWDLRQEFKHPDLATTNKQILADLEGGVTSILLRLDCAARGGTDADDPAAEELSGRDGVAAYHVDDLDAVLKDVELDMVGLALEAGAAFLPAAAQVVALWRRRGLSAEQASGAFNADPLAVLARDGQLPTTSSAALEAMADLAKWTSENYPNVTAVRVGTAAYHHAGATVVQDIAFSMATGIEYLRSMTAAGMSVEDAAKQILFSMSVGTHQFLSIAKLRAARSLWARVVEACGGKPEAAAMKLHTRVSKRVLTARDPYVNMLRNTVAVFAAGVGGAEVITSEPFDVVLGLPDANSRRVARNTLHVLQDESHLNRIVDPAGGSWYMDWLADQFARKAWDLMQEIERQGGMTKAIESGWVADQIESAFTPRAKGIASRKEGITGVSEFPNVAEDAIVRETPDLSALRKAASDRLASARYAGDGLGSLASASCKIAAASEAAAAGASIGQLAKAIGFGDSPTQITPVAPHPFAAPFEVLRDASDKWLEEKGSRPQVFLANLGPIAHHTARATFSKNFFEAGGFEVPSNNGFADVDAAVAAFAESGAKVAVICSSDKLYPEFVPDAAAKLKAAGARTVVLAGHPGENEAAWSQAGVDRFIFIKCDVLSTLADLLREEGVLQ
ncbi:methylmalonyl-CoA mutase family protein [Aeoliella mucimassa]|uniref:Methylmalonyl-CoA mutase small subunit n=1 Tax=Aeoliella mucimassa TaxID=2527972 RepID=A0A518AQ42_9BACT|nr:methylmalonyl-CoA mutase family protein [Aeoliella mucimassa]QDU56836.1 Methylmalonyl-CoA mutase small subunit [Aeoliella mucimassa]